MDVVVEFQLSEDVSEESRYSLAVQLAEIISKAVEDKELEVPDGEIEDIEVHYEDSPF